MVLLNNLTRWPLGSVGWERPIWDLRATVCIRESHKKVFFGEMDTCVLLCLCCESFSCECVLGRGWMERVCVRHENRDWCCLLGSDFQQQAVSSQLLSRFYIYQTTINFMMLLDDRVAAIYCLCLIMSETVLTRKMTRLVIWANDCEWCTNSYRHLLGAKTPQNVLLGVHTVKNISSRLFGACCFR